ncbi:hypothetical protein LZ31DRAFT_551565 [Colletotrichum somersetense]|nr:hypothetical protein LZ31DRAFT_551565 [Colletotrichum somersetense]
MIVRFQKRSLPIRHLLVHALALCHYEKTIAATSKPVKFQSISPDEGDLPEVRTLVRVSAAWQRCLEVNVPDSPESEAASKG